MVAPVGSAARGARYEEVPALRRSYYKAQMKGASLSVAETGATFRKDFGDRR
jgi:hypothetical protein